MTDVPVALLVVVAVLAIALAATLSAGEVAVGRVTRAAVAELAAAGHPAAARVGTLSVHHGRVQSAASFVRIVAEMTATVCLTLAVADATALPWWGVLLVSVAVCAGVAFLLVRMSPRRVGRRHPAATLARTWPLLVGVTALAGGVGRPEPVGEHAEEEQEEELRDMVQRVAESGAIEDEERELFRSVLELGDRLTREVMVPRPDMITVHAATPLPKALSLLLRSGFSRAPVTGDSVDDLRGVLYLKDLVRHLQDSGDDGRAGVEDLARAAVFVPESKPVDALLRELQSGSSHLALVVDEYGGIAGLVTIEDALEELVGELTDEHDPDAPVVEEVEPGVYRVPARLGRDELGELFGLEVDDEDVDTAGGLLAKALGKVPLPGSAGDIHGLHLRAERVEGRRKRLATVLVSRTHEPADDDETADASPGRGEGEEGPAVVDEERVRAQDGAAR